MASHKTVPGGALSFLQRLAPEREIFLRTGGKVRFLRITTRFQLVAIGCAALAVLLWTGGTLAMIWNQAGVVFERTLLARERAAVSSREANVHAYERSVDAIADDIEARQRVIQQMMQANIGPAPSGQEADAVVGREPAKGAATRKPLSDASPETERMEALLHRQRQLEAELSAAARMRLARVEQAIRSFGLNPAQLNAAQGGQGGPFIPAARAVATQPGLRELADLLGRLNAMETVLAAIPSGRPTDAPMETSSYGYRRDPFNGELAFHSGIDFPGRYGQTILAAAPGRVSYVGPRSGYGQVVEVEHGRGIMTRYAHLSGYGVRVGQQVRRGEAIARMGSTGRSTGTHLHFEVRVNGAAVNPRPFLEAREDVLEIQQLAKRRLAGSGHRG